VTLPFRFTSDGFRESLDLHQFHTEDESFPVNEFTQTKKLHIGPKVTSPHVGVELASTDREQNMKVVQRIQLRGVRRGTGGVEW
jgi:hypothetical protein